MRFIRANRYGRGRGGARIRWLVVHDMEAPESKDTAENIARYFSRTSRAASAHYCHDVNSTVQCVRDGDRAWHAPPLNEESLGLEHAGYAKQSRNQWRDDYSLTMLRTQSAPLAARKCEQYNIPIRYVNQREIRNGKAGITTHDDVSEAWGQSSHWDPGPHFPMGYYIELVESGGNAMPSAEDVAKEVLHGELIEVNYGGNIRTVSLASVVKNIEGDTDSIPRRVWEHGIPWKPETNPEIWAQNLLLNNESDIDQTQSITREMRDILNGLLTEIKALRTVQGQLLEIAKNLSTNPADIDVEALIQRIEEKIDNIRVELVIATDSGTDPTEEH